MRSHCPYHESFGASPTDVLLGEVHPLLRGRRAIHDLPVAVAYQVRVGACLSERVTVGLPVVLLAVHVRTVLVPSTLEVLKRLQRACDDPPPLGHLGTLLAGELISDKSPLLSGCRASQVKGLVSAKYECSLRTDCAITTICGRNLLWFGCGILRTAILSFCSGGAGRLIGLLDLLGLNWRRKRALRSLFISFSPSNHN